MQLSILIDLQNLFRACESVEAIVGEIINRALRQGEIQEVRLFVPNYQSISPWQAINSLQQKYGVEVSVCLTLKEGERKEILKDAVDFEVLKWVMNHVHKDIGPELLVFVTGDSHFVISANEAHRRGKKVEFWCLEKGVSKIIRCQEKSRTIKFAPPIQPANGNLFLASIEKLNSQGPLNDDDRARLRMINKVARGNIRESFGAWPISSETLESLGCKWKTSKDECQKIIEALMVLGIARIYPAMSTTVSIDVNSPLFSWIASSVEE